ncbi:MAG: N-acetylmuramoyl-L-alanine amidase [Ilumatobacteraceae bacterium]
MCDACERTAPHLDAGDLAPPRPLGRRALLRRGLAAGGVLAAGWLLPDVLGEGERADAAAGDGGDDDDDDSSVATRSKPTAVGRVDVTTQIPQVNDTGVPAPSVVSRAGWRCDESVRVNVRQFAPIRKLIVHHTASDNQPADPAAVVRQTYRYHAVGRGFGDIGYNFLIDHRGRIYEGRFARNYAAGEAITGEDLEGWGVVGAHAKTMNHGSCGVCLIGDFELAAPSDAAIVSLTNLLAWKAGRHRIDGLEDDVYENLYRGFYRFDNITGHRDVGATLCPGRKLEARLAGVRTAVTKRAGHWPSQVVDIPAVVRTERGAPAAAPTTTTATSEASTAPTTSPAGASSSGTSVAGYRAVTAGGVLLGTSKLKAYGKPSSAVVALAAPGVGDGYATVTAAGTVVAFGAVAAAGATTGGGEAVDLAVARSGSTAWVLRSDGSVAAVGGRAYGSPKQSGVGRAGVAIECRPGGDGYWVLTADGAVRGYGAAKTLGTAKGSGTPIDVAVNAAGSGAYVLYDSGAVVAVGAAKHAGDLTTMGTRWMKPAAAISAVPGGGYVISARDGGLFSFGGAPYLGSFAGSGATVVGLAVACR